MTVDLRVGNGMPHLRRDAGATCGLALRRHVLSPLFAHLARLVRPDGRLCREVVGVAEGKADPFRSGGENVKYDFCLDLHGSDTVLTNDAMKTLQANIETLVEWFNVSDEGIDERSLREDATVARLVRSLQDCRLSTEDVMLKYFATAGEVTSRENFSYSIHNSKNSWMLTKVCPP